MTSWLVLWLSGQSIAAQSRCGSKADAGNAGGAGGGTLCVAARSSSGIEVALPDVHAPHIAMQGIMNTVVTSFMSRLQKEYLKARGYTKQRFTYSRQMDGYVERIRLRGSSWNYPERPWSFHIDLGVKLDGYPTSDRSFPHTHTNASLHLIVKDATGDYSLRHNPSVGLGAQIMDRLDPSRQEVRVPDQSELLAEVACHIAQASEAVQSAKDEVRRLCLSDDFSDRHFAIVRAIEKLCQRK